MSLAPGGIRLDADSTRPELYKGKRVLLVGLGNTSGDLADNLVGVASSVHIAHSHGAYIVCVRPKSGRNGPVLSA